MKHLTATLLTLAFAINLLALHAAVPLSWTVETTRVQPVTFDVVRGETIALEASFNNAGKPFAMDGYDCSIFWQTNGMGSAWWTAPAAAASNRVSATFTPEMDPGTSTVIGFLGSTGQIYRAAFQLRFRHGPGATPNALPLPVPVIDFAKVRVLNPPWSGGGGGGVVDTNAVRDIIHKTVDGAARPLPKYLHALDFCDSYPEEAAAYYRSRGDGKVDGGCSSVRSGGFLSRNFDFPFDNRSEFVVKMSAGKDRFASVGVAQIGTNLTEEIVTSGKPEYSARYKWLPGATVDGINDRGVACNINVVDGDPQTSGWHATGDLHPLAAVRWILDNATNAQHGAEYIAANIRFPQGWSQNYHYMVCDESSTYIVENGTAYPIIGRPVMTNLRIAVEPNDGPGIERYNILMNPESSITNVWYTKAYRRETIPPWVSDLAEVIDYTNQIFDAWASHPKEYFRGKTNDGQPWWQSIHTSVYDLTNRTLRVAVQEQDDWYVFAVPSAGGVKPEAVREIVEPMIEGKLDGPTVAPSQGATVGQAADARSTGDALANRVRFDGEQALTDEQKAQARANIGATVIPYPFENTWADRAKRSDFSYVLYDGTGGIGEEYKIFYAQGKWKATDPDNPGGFNLEPTPDISGKLDGPTVMPSTDESARGKAADAKDTGDALAGKLGVNDEADGAVNARYLWGLDGGGNYYQLYFDGYGFVINGNGNTWYLKRPPDWLFEYEEDPITAKLDAPAATAVTNGHVAVFKKVTNPDETVTVKVEDGGELPLISATDKTFSNAVLAVGLNIDTNIVAVLNEIAATFGDFPITGTATTVGGLLAALVAAVAWLRKRKVDKLTVTGMAAEATAEDGTAKLDDFFKESNSLLTSRIGALTKTNAESVAQPTNAVTLNDDAPMTITVATVESPATPSLAVTFADARQSGGLRICELYILNGTADTDLTFDAAVQFVCAGDSFPACEAGINYFVFAEVAANLWKVTRETLKSITTPTPVAAA